ncbi:MAG: hypothetical protein NWQ38_00755 [Cellulophaga sp.]|nr:hypothetical protein [Cellulophaga sp.]
MKKRFYNPLLFGLILIILASACEESSIDNSQEGPPSSFELLTVAEDATNVALTPEFSWQAATDPEGDTVVYDLYLSAYDRDITLVASNLATNSYTLPDPLENFENYVWKVIAKDSEGNTTESTSKKFTTRGYTLNLNTSDIGAILRSGYNTFAFNNHQWLLGGFKGVGTDPGYLDDIYRSTDGVIWTIANGDATFDPRTFHTSVVHDSKVWVIGGESGVRPSATFNLNDVWSSLDGVNWTEATSTAAFSKRRYLSSVSFNNRLWIIGGQDGNFNWKNDVWSSSDGISWTEATSAAPFTPRGNVKTLVFDNKLWVIGGNDDDTNLKNDIWYTTNGSNWTQVTLPTNFAADPNNYGLGAVVFKSKLLVFRGNTVYFTKNTSDWFTGTLDVPSSGANPINLASENIFEFDNTLSLIFGTDFSGAIKVYNYSD